MAEKQLQLVLVTPEKTVLDEPVEALRLPLYDGQFGILSGRAPMVGRVGYGELKVTTREGAESYFVDGGFIQVKGPVVSILTNRCLPKGELDAEEARRQLDEARGTRPRTDADAEQRERAQERARRMLALAGG